MLVAEGSPEHRFEEELDPWAEWGARVSAIAQRAARPVALPQVVCRITGLDPNDSRFRADYIDQVQRIIRHFSGTSV